MALYNPDAANRFGWATPAVFFVAFIFFISYTNRAIIGPLLVHMEIDMGLDHAQASSLLAFLSLGQGTGVLLAGFLIALVPPRRMICISLAGAGVSLLLASRGASLGEARLCITLLGLISGLYLPSAMATLGTLVRPESWSMAVSVHELAPAVSFIFAPILAESAAAAYGWQGGMQLMGGVSLCTALLFLFLGKGGRETVERPSVAGTLAGLRQPVFWIFIWLFGLSIGTEFAPYSVLPLSLTAEQGLGSAEASQLLSISRLPAPFMVLLGGWAVGRLGIRKSLLLYLVVQGAALIALGIPHETVGTAGVLAAMLLQSLSAGFVFPALFTLFAESFPRGRQPMFLSLSLPVASYMGGGLVPYLLGLSGDCMTFAFGYGMFGLACFATIPLLLFCKK